MIESASGTSPISVSGLTKFYGNFLAVDNVSFNVEKGEIVGFLGPNGAGKSTVLKILTCYLSATRGLVSVAGHNVYRQPLAVRRKVGYQPENVPLYDEMVVYDYLLFMSKMRGVPRSKRTDRIEYVSKTCGLQKVMGRQIRELSKGFRQRVGLAQALVHDPDVLILDEPMSGLDPNQIIEVRDLIKHIGEKKTVIFSSHILQEIEKICDRILIIDEGRIIADETITGLSALIKGNRRYRISVQVESEEQEREVKAELEQYASRIQRVPQAAGARGGATFEVTTKEDHDIRADVFEKVKEKGWTLLELNEVTLTLEDAFRALTGKDQTDKPMSEKPVAEEHIKLVGTKR
jgi:ABC-2 type transport system ATP-binding protein